MLFRSPNDKKKWVVDPEAAAVVQKIFSLCIGGLGPTQIARWLSEHRIKSPTAYLIERGLPSTHKPTNDPYKWITETVSRILERVEYLGHTVNFRIRRQSYKSSKMLRNDPDEWEVFENTQEPIVEESVFLIVQGIRQSRRRPTKMGEMSMLSGLLYCADCGGIMYQCRANKFKPKQEFFICSTYRKDRALCTTHSIRNVVLEEIILLNLREAIQYVSEYEHDFILEAEDITLQQCDGELMQKRDALVQSEKRIAELDLIIKHLYEDSITRKISEERFARLSRDYELEQHNLASMLEVLRENVKQQEKKRSNAKSFIAAVKKYTDLNELTATVLREFIDKIYVSKTSGKVGCKGMVEVREIEIVYNFIGAFDFQNAIDQSRERQDTKNVGVV